MDSATSGTARYTTQRRKVRIERDYPTARVENPSFSICRKARTPGNTRYYSRGLDKLSATAAVSFQASGKAKRRVQHKLSTKQNRKKGAASPHPTPSRIRSSEANHLTGNRP